MRLKKPVRGRAHSRRQCKLLAAQRLWCAAETLEPRCLLAAFPPIISELLASNDLGLKDFQQEAHDWIEIYNPNATAINLQDYALTDGNDVWRFPATLLDARSYLYVFASGKDRAIPGQELHTSFQLDKEGEYLALLDPGGAVVQEFSPQFPPQRTDVSYGLISGGPVTTTHIGPGASLRALVPASDSLGATWTGRIFNDANWLGGVNGVGYETNIGSPLPREIESNNTIAQANDASGNFAQASNEFYQLSARGESASTTQPDYFNLGPLDAGDVLTIALAGVGSGRGAMPNAYLELYRVNNNLAAPTLVASDDNSGPGGSSDALIHRFVIAESDTYLVRVRPATNPGGTYDLALWLESAGPAPATDGQTVDDVEPNNTPATANDLSRAWRRANFLSHTTGTAGSNDDLFKFQFNAGDLVTITVDALSTMDASVYLMDAAGQTIASDDGTSSVPSPYQRDANIHAFRIPATGTYYVREHKNSGFGSQSYALDVYLSTAFTPPGTAAYTSLIHTNIQPQMQGRNTSAYIRIPFVIDEVAAIESLVLRMQYEDGFVAYLNGQPVASRNAPDTLDYRSAATAARTKLQAITLEEIDITEHKDKLVLGSNVLAIHGLNYDAGDTSFLVLPELLSTTTREPGYGYCKTPTPGKPNEAGALGIVADTAFDHDRGFYDAPFDLVISTQTDEAEIHYTLDGTPPTTSSPLYTAPIRIGMTTTLRAAAFKAGYLPTNVDTQTYIFLDDVIRQSPTGARPTSPGSWPNAGTVNGQIINYGMDPEIVDSPLYRDTIKNDLMSIPTYSIVMDLKDLFDPSRGIYVNAYQDGRSWERPASVELIYPDGREGFQENAGIRIRGGYSRTGDNPKHAFRLLFRDEYGAGKLHFPVFGPDGPTEFDGFDLRCAQNYSWSFDPGSGNGVFIRDQFSRDTQLAMGWQSERGDFVHLYINGQYWGLYNTAERPEASYGEWYYGGDKDDYDVIKVEAGSYTINATDGDLAAWTELWNQARAGLASDAAYWRIQGRNPDGTINPAYKNLLDVDNLIDYMLVILYGGNLDAPISNFLGNTRPNNFYAIRNRNGTEGFRFVAHDSEHTLLSVTADRTGPYQAGSTLEYSNPQYIWQQLQANAEFRLRVADRIQKHFFNGGVFYVNPASPKWDPEHPENNVPAARFMRRKDEIDRAVVAESARWGDSKREPPFQRDTHWVNAVNSILNNFFPQRSSIVFNQLKADKLYPALNAPQFSQFGGVFSDGFQLQITTQGGVIYYTLDGSDPRRLGGAVAETALVYSGAISLHETTTVKARVLSGGTWSALVEATFALDMSDLRITEFMYHPADDPSGTYNDDDFEFVELTNLGNKDIDLTGVKLADAIDFQFNEQTVGPDRLLAPAQRIVVARRPDAFRSRYGTTTADGQPIWIVGPYSGKLDNSSETLRLEGPAGQIIEQFTYNASDNNSAWYDITDGEGYSLVAVNPSASNAMLSNKSGWRPSEMPGGAPGAADPGTSPNAIIINEVVRGQGPGASELLPADPLPLTPDPYTWVELYNTTSQPIDISGWFLSNDPLDLTRYQIEPGTIVPPKGFYVFSEAEHFGGAFTLGDLEERLLLSSNYNGQPGGYRESVKLWPAEPGASFGQYVKSNGKNDFVELIQATRGQPNAPPRIGPVVINEIMYNPLSGQDEFLELKNITDTPIDLFDPDHPQNTWKFTAGITFSFAHGDQIPPNGYALVVGISPTLFRDRYDIPDDVPIFGPYTGVLDGAGESIELARPGNPRDDGSVPYLLVEQIKYESAAPWPTRPAGSGASLARVDADRYGNDVINWLSDPIGGTPGFPNRGQVVPEVFLGADANIVTGQTFTRNASFVDPNEGQTWSATVDWGDGSPQERVVLDADQKFRLTHVFVRPGVFTVAVSVIDSNGGIGVGSIQVSVALGNWVGGNGPDSFTLKMDPTGTDVQFFEDAPGVAEPVFSVSLASLSTIDVHMFGDDDLLTIDLTNGSPLPTGGILFDGGSAITGDRIRIINGSLDVEYRPDPAYVENGRLVIASRTIYYFGAESILIENVPRVSLVTPNSIDTLLVDSPEPGQTRLSGNSGGLDLLPLVAINVPAFAIDAAANELVASDDLITIADGAFGPAQPTLLTLGVGLGNNRLLVNGGQFTLDTSAGVGPAYLKLALSGAAHVSIPSAQEFASIDLGGNASLAVSAASHTALRTRGLTIADQAHLDLGQGDLILQATPATRDQLLAQMTGWVKAGRSGQAGIVANAANPMAGLGMMLNDRGGGMGPWVTSFAGQTVDANCILVKYTWNGDANLDGVVNADDYFLIDNGYITQQGGYRNGDFNYDGVTNADDYFLIDSAYIAQTGPLFSTRPVAWNTATGSRKPDEAIDVLAEDDALGF